MHATTFDAFQFSPRFTPYYLISGARRFKSSLLRMEGNRVFAVVGEWINEFIGLSLGRRNTLYGALLLQKTVLAAEDSPSINSLAYGEKGILPTPKLDETEGIQCLGHSNWTICILLSPFYWGNLPTFSFSHWEANSYCPRGPIIGKGEFSQLQNWMRQMGLGAWDIQTGPFVSSWAPFIEEIFQLFHFHTGRPILIAPEAQ